MLKRLLASALDLVFPPLCHVCRSYIPSAGLVHICPACRERMTPVVSPLCSVCGIPFAGAGSDHPCGTCSRNRPSFDTARGGFVYDGAVSDLIHSFKYRNKTHLRRPLAVLTVEVLADAITAMDCDMVMPVPLHRRKLSRRGFNQAVLIGGIIARHSGLPFDRYSLRRIRWTEPQVGLDADARRSNVRGAFEVAGTDSLQGRRVMLIDDVYTTGSTVDECARVLKRAGAAAVHVVTVARALK